MGGQVGEPTDLALIQLSLQRFWIPGGRLLIFEEIVGVFHPIKQTFDLLCKLSSLINSFTDLKKNNNNHI